MSIKKILCGSLAAAAATAAVAVSASASIIKVPAAANKTYYEGTGANFRVNWWLDGTDHNCDAGIDLTKTTGVAVTFTIPEMDSDGYENAEWFEGNIGGAVIFAQWHNDMNDDAALKDKYNWVQKEWWGCPDPDVGAEGYALPEDYDKELKAEKVGTLTYKVTATGYGNAIANGDVDSLGAQYMGFMLWGGDEVEIEVTKVELLDDAGTVLAVIDGNANIEVTAAGKRGGGDAPAPADPGTADPGTADPGTADPGTANTDPKPPVATGVEGIAVAVSAAALAGGVIVASKKRR